MITTPPKLLPMLRYYGGKHRAVSGGRYPRPLHDTIVEPFPFRAIGSAKSGPRSQRADEAVWP